VISLSGLVSIVVYLIVAGLILWLLWWLVGYVGLPEPFRKVANVVLAVVAVLIVIGILLSMLNGGAQPLFRP
jgi:heme A synthase